MSKPYIISYDLHSPGQKYEDVKTVISTFGGARIKVLESTWLVRNNLTPTEMTDSLAQVIDSNDSLFIAELNQNYQGHLSKETWKFIKENILF